MLDNGGSVTPTTPREPHPWSATMSAMTETHVHRNHPVREGLRWIRETPAPEWGDEPSAKARVTGYVGVSMALWTAIGVGGAVLVVRALELIPPVLG